MVTELWNPFEKNKHTYASTTYDKNGNKIAESIGFEVWRYRENLLPMLTTTTEYDKNIRLTTNTDAVGL